MKTRSKIAIGLLLSSFLGAFPLLAKHKYFPKDRAELLKLVKNESIKLDEIYTGKIADMSFLFCGYDGDGRCKDSAKVRKDFSGIESWDVSNVENMSGMFSGVRSFNQPLEKWDVSKVWNMSEMFEGATSFNQSLESWDVSNVTNMEYMFEGATSMNPAYMPKKKPIELNSENKYLPKDKAELLELVNDENIKLDKIDTSKITDMSRLFCGEYDDKWCQDSAQDRRDFSGIESWDVSNVENMEGMFRGAESFNQPLESWNVSNVESMTGMFWDATSFNQPLEKWNVSKVGNMKGMFKGATSFNQPLEKWDVNNVKDMSGMFMGAKSFNQSLEMWNTNGAENMKELSVRYKYLPKNKTELLELIQDRDIELNEIDTSKITDMSYLFCEDDNDEYENSADVCMQGRENFSGIESWDVSNVKDMGGMFMGAKSFNQSLESWDVSKVQYMDSMFKDADSFNQPLEKWDVGKVRWMDDMFWNAESFNQPLNKWDVSNVYGKHKIFSSATSMNPIYMPEENKLFIP